MESWKQLAGLSFTYLLRWALCSNTKRFVSHSSHSLMPVELSFLFQVVSRGQRLLPCYHLASGTCGFHTYLQQWKRPRGWHGLILRPGPVTFTQIALAGTQSHGPAKLQGRLGNGSSLWAQEEERGAWAGEDVVWTQKEAYYCNKLWYIFVIEYDSAIENQVSEYVW